MKLYGGIDLHSNNCVVVLVEEDGRELLRKHIDNDLSKMIALLEPYRSDITGLVVESTYNWYWFTCKGLFFFPEIIFDMHLLHPCRKERH
jgi:hypothetical protein